MKREYSLKHREVSSLLLGLSAPLALEFTRFKRTVKVGRRVGGREKGGGLAGGENGKHGLRRSIQTRHCSTLCCPAPRSHARPSVNPTWPPFQSGICVSHVSGVGCFASHFQKSADTSGASRDLRLASIPRPWLPWRR